SEDVTLKAREYQQRSMIFRGRQMSMAYGDVMKPGIPENSDLIFDVELLACENDEMPSLDMTQM
ncbi:MAG: hypothetical protein ACKO96_14595, partial [Flammeovirgaceae bacterium]